jgi:hypothetical protein
LALGWVQHHAYTNTRGGDKGACGSEPVQLKV